MRAGGIEARGEPTPAVRARPVSVCFDDSRDRGQGCFDPVHGWL